MDEFISHDIPVEKERSRSPKDKHVAVNGSDLDTDDHENPSDELFCNFLQGQGRSSEQINPIQFETYNANLDKFFDFGPPPNGGEPLPTESKFTRAASNGGLLIMNEALNASRLEVRTAQFKAEAAGREVARLREEVAANSLRERELAVKEARRAYKKGKKEVAEIMKTRFAQFSDDFGELKKNYKSVGHYRECQGTVCGLYLTQSSGYSYDNEMAKQSKRMDRFANVDYMIHEIEKNILEQWYPIPLSPDSE
ncbi:hypothetical protein Bca101_010284 [Brassica carinata]